MAKLAAKPHLVASLNVMLASRQRQARKNAFTQDEIVELMMSMADHSQSYPAHTINKAGWYRSGELV